MTNPILETIAEIAMTERRTAIKDGEYGWAVLAAIVEDWAINESRREGGDSTS
jgi:hypothetical protein